MALYTADEVFFRVGPWRCSQHILQRNNWQYKS